MKKQFISGYFGLMDYTNISYHQGPSIYALTDHAHSLLILIPFSYAFFEEAYKVARHVSYKDVYVIMPSVNDRTISDLYNLCIALIQLKGMEHVHWMNPDICHHNDMQMIQIKVFDLHMNNMGASLHFDFDPNIIFVPDNDMPGLYDILLWDGYDRHYFTESLTEDKAISLGGNKHLIIHVPYHSPYIHESILSEEKILTQKWIPLYQLQIHSFPSVDILKSVNEHWDLHKEGVIYNALI